MRPKMSDHNGVEVSVLKEKCSLRHSKSFVDKRAAGRELFLCLSAFLLLKFIHVKHRQFYVYVNDFLYVKHILSMWSVCGRSACTVSKLCLIAEVLERKHHKVTPQYRLHINTPNTKRMSKKSFF